MFHLRKESCYKVIPFDFFYGLNYFSSTLIYYLLVIWCIARTLPVYVQKDSTDAYLYQDNLPELSEFTICFWLNRDKNSAPVDDYLVSLAVSGEYIA